MVVSPRRSGAGQTLFARRASTPRESLRNFRHAATDTKLFRAQRLRPQFRRAKSDAPGKMLEDMNQLLGKVDALLDLMHTEAPSQRRSVVEADATLTKLLQERRQTLEAIQLASQSMPAQKPAGKQSPAASKRPVGRSPGNSPRGAKRASNQRPTNAIVPSKSSVRSAQRHPCKSPQRSSSRPVPEAIKGPKEEPKVEPAEPKVEVKSESESERELGPAELERLQLHCQVKDLQKHVWTMELLLQDTEAEAEASAGRVLALNAEHEQHLAEWNADMRELHMLQSCQLKEMQEAADLEAALCKVEAELAHAKSSHPRKLVEVLPQAHDGQAWEPSTPRRAMKSPPRMERSVEKSVSPRHSVLKSISRISPDSPCDPEKSLSPERGRSPWPRMGHPLSFRNQTTAFDGGSTSSAPGACASWMDGFGSSVRAPGSATQHVAQSGFQFAGVGGSTKSEPGGRSGLASVFLPNLLGGSTRMTARSMSPGGTRKLRLRGRSGSPQPSQAFPSPGLHARLQGAAAQVHSPLRMHFGPCQALVPVMPGTLRAPSGSPHRLAF